MPILIDTRGTARDVPDDLVEGALAAGWRPDTNADVNARATAAANEAAYGGVGGTIKAGLAAGLRGATVGLSDVALRALGGEDAAIELQGLRDENPLVSTLAEIGGAVAPALITGGAAVPAGAAVRAGRAAGVAAGGGFRGAVAAGAAEGALFGAGQGVSELALSTDPLTLERAASAIGSNVLYGGITGGALGAAGNLVERGLVRAKGALDARLAKRANVKAKTPEEAIESGDLQLLDRKTLDAAEKAEIERLTAAQAPRRKAVVDELDGYRNNNRDAHDLREAAVGSSDRDIKEAGAAFTRADMNLRRLLDDRVGLAEKPIRALPFLRAQEQSLEEIGVWARNLEKRWEEAVAYAPTETRANIIAGKVPGEIGPFTKSGLDFAVERAMKNRLALDFGGAFEDGLKKPAIVKLLPEYQAVLDWNRKFQRQLAEFEKPHSSELLAKIGEARDALGAPKAPSLGGAALSAAATFGGPLGAVAAGAGRAIGGMRLFATAAAERTGKAVSTFLGAAGNVAAPAAVVATRALGSVRYAKRAHDEESEPKTLPELYRKRTDEIKSRTAYDETGTPRLRPEARAEMAQILRPVAAVDPIAADRLETIATRRIEYLSSKIPRRPDFGMPQIGPDNWQPSDMAMRAFARTVAAVEDPGGVEDRAAAGAISPEDVEAYWAVHPERAQHFKTEILAALSESKTALPYERAAALSMLVGKPLHPSLHPRMISVLQGQFPIEPGTAGGTQSPRPAPQFGAVEKLSDDAKTPAQERME